ncbi:hypothetical protein AQUCO_00100866v1, partial [Aquilegia coerulea]
KGHVFASTFPCWLQFLLFHTSTTFLFHSLLSPSLTQFKKMKFLNLVCPNSSSSVSDVNGFSQCFNYLVLGFGVNLITILLLIAALLRLIKRNVAGTTTTTTRIRRMLLPEKILWYLLPSLGVCLSLHNLLLLSMRALQGHHVVYYEWSFRCSQFLVWAIIILFWRHSQRSLLVCNQVLCFWWIARLLLTTAYFFSVFSSLKVLYLFEESVSLLVDVVFGVFLNVVRVMQTSTKRSSHICRNYGLEDPLLDCEEDLEELHHTDLNPIAINYWRMLTFKSVNPVMACGSRKQLNVDDLIQLPIELNPSSSYSALLSCWVVEQSKNSSPPSLFGAIYYAYRWPYFCLGLLKVFNDCIGFAGPLLLNKLIWFLQKGSGNLDGYILALALGLSSVIKSFLDTQYTFRLSKLKLKLRASIMSIIYRKCLFVSLAERSIFSEGEIQTFMSIDAERTVNMCNSLHDVWSLPLQIGVALYLLYTQVKFAFLSGITITILLIPVNRWLAILIARATQEMMKQKDERIQRSGELLTYIRTLKMYGWELLFAGRLRDTRVMEVKFLSTRKYLDAWCVFFWATTPTLFSLFTFGLFTLTGNTLNAATVFTCLALFNTLISPLNSFPWVINGLVDAIVSTRRLSNFLSCSEITSEPVQIAEPSSLPITVCLAEPAQHMAVVMRNVSSVWSSSKEEQSSVLHNITLDLPKGFLITVIGEVGSGKSSLLNSVLGEMRLIQGSMHSHGSIAYVPQVSWIMSGTIRDNILFGKNYDAKRYTEVLEACALDVDVALMAGGDLSYVGEKGVTLSGGQKVRVALARAVYHGANIFLLDDVLSAVDAQVACWILHKAIQGPLMNQQTRILCTHNPQAIYLANMIVIMDKGHVKWTGLLAEFVASPYSTIPSLKESLVSTSQLLEQESNNSSSGESIHPESDYLGRSEEAQVTETETRKEGTVDLSVYKNYAKFCSWPITVVVCLSAVLMQASRNGNDLWLSFWVDTTAETHKTKYSTSFYLVILCIFCVINSFLTLARAFSFAFGGLRAAVQVHNRLLNKLISAPVQFFDQTPTGRILNRLSSDLYTIDDSLPFILNILLANFIGLVGLLIILSYVQVIFLILLLPFWYVYSNLQFYYRSTSRELRRLDSVARSPIYASFTETLDGSSTIRAFGAKEHFLARFIEHIALYQQTSYSEVMASLWLSLRLQLLAAFVIFFIAVMAVIGSRGGFPINFSSPGLVGLALSYAAPFVSLLSSYLASFTETEKEMVSVERVLQYMDVPQEDLQGRISVHPNWPFQGQIDFQHVTLRYMPSLPAALNDITFTIAGGTQVGIIGRTGAGKSSVLNALFRLSPICGGSIFVDKVNVVDVPIRDLRSQFAVVPQSPFLFQGSLRDNLDPYQMIDDSMIWETLEKCHVKDEVEAAGGLMIHIKEGGISFSVGQRQLLCLARALLRSSKLLCLDECTANVDTQTASILQNAICGHCEWMTVITIAHRISTVMNMDNILILDQGVLVEQGNPRALLQDGSSIFSSFAKASTL